jgi:hypothetical protein
MQTGDDDYSTETESNASFSALDFDSIVQEAEARRVSPRELVRNMRKKQKTETKPCAVMPAKLHTIVMMDKHISNLLHGQDYDYNASLRVIGAALRMQKDHLLKVQRVGKEKAKYVEKPRIRDYVCHLFHIGHDASSTIVGGYLHNRSIYQSGKGGEGRAGNSTAKETRRTRSKGMQIAVRQRFRLEPSDEPATCHCKASAGFFCTAEAPIHTC